MRRQLQTLAATGDPERAFTWTAPDNPREACLEVRQLDGRGVATEWSEPVCLGVDVDGAGCATLGGRGGGWLALGFAIATSTRSAGRRCRRPP